MGEMRIVRGVLQNGQLCANRDKSSDAKMFHTHTHTQTAKIDTNPMAVVCKKATPTLMKQHCTTIDARVRH